ncbi:MAG: cobalamin biosynthesis protein [Nitrososphaerales archaeon]
MEIIIILALALLLDLFLGEPPNKIHPVVYMGKLISFLKDKLPKSKASGIILAFIVIALFTLPTFFIFNLKAINYLAYLIISVLILKTTFAIKAMDNYLKPIEGAVKKKEYEEAKKLLTHVVRRDTKRLNEQQIISASVETIAEGTVDGLISPIFYYLLFGIPGAMAYRAVNTLDSMVGYKDEENRLIGYFSAKLDTLANYIPARITGILTILSSIIFNLRWKNAFYIMVRDAKGIESYNAGYPMASVAGALGVMLEKPNHYKLGIRLRDLEHKDISIALKIMKLNLILFLIIFYIPLTLINGLIWLI